MRNEPCASSVRPGVFLNRSRPKKHVGGTLGTGTLDEQGPDTGFVRTSQNNIQRALHGRASARAVLIRATIVRKPSIPGRQALLWRDQRCQTRPAKVCCTVQAFGT